MTRTHRLCAVISLLACPACPGRGPDQLSELAHVRPAVLIRASGLNVSVVVNYDEDASGGCARLQDLAGTANGAALTADELGGHSTSRCMHPPSRASCRSTPHRS